MNELITDLKSLELETLKNLKNSKAANTLRAYQADFKDFSIFCTKNGLSSMPTEPKILSIYLTHLAASSKFSTLKRRIASISVIHKMKGHYLDTKHPIIMENLHGIKRVRGINQKAKKPILINDLKSIINKIDEIKQPEKIPAVTHVDGTGRLQSVSRDSNPLYYDLINEFYKITDVPVIINTSMNVMGEPIVNTPEQAFNMLTKTDMDYAILGNHIISKNED